MDSKQLFIQQQLGEDVKAWYSQTFAQQAVVNGINNEVRLNFINEKVKLILCTGLWVAYNSIIAPVQIVDTYGNNFFDIPLAAGANRLISGMYHFDFISNGAAITIIANNVAFSFTLFYQKVYSFNDKA